MNKFMMYTLTSAMVTLASSANAYTTTPGDVMQVAKIGAPFCPSAEAMKDVIVEAILSKGRGGNMRGCAMARPGVRVLVLENLGEEDGELHGVKIRYSGKVAFTMNIGLEKTDSSSAPRRKISKKRGK